MTDPKKNEIELYPDAMERFERTVTVVAKAPPQHRSQPAKKKKPPKAKKPGK